MMTCVEQDDYTQRYVWNRTTIHKDMCGTGRLYTKICVEQDDYTRRCVEQDDYTRRCVEQDEFT